MLSIAVMTQFGRCTTAPGRRTRTIFTSSIPPFSRSASRTAGLRVFQVTSGCADAGADGYGRTVGWSDFWQTGGGTLVASLPVQAPPTIYRWIGDSFAYAAIIVLCLLVLWALTHGLLRRATSVSQGAQI